MTIAEFRARLRRQRGAAMVEAAMVTPLIAMIVFGIFEFGLLFRSYLTVTASSGQAARAASVAASSPSADYLILQTVSHAMEPHGLENVQRIVVYHASGPGDPVPTACLGGSVNDVCNYYTAADVALPYVDEAGAVTGNWGCDVGARDVAWCPMDRETDITGAGPDYVGVYVETRHNLLTGMIGSSILLDETTVTRLEPKALQ